MFFRPRVQTLGCRPRRRRATDTVLFDTWLCIGNGLAGGDARLPQAQRVLHVDETRVLPQLPVCVVGHPSLPVVGVHHFPERE